MKFIIGLGNPGDHYTNTRHNAGWLALEDFRRKHNYPAFRSEKDFQALVSEHKTADDTIRLVLPQTFMNESGHSAQKLLHFYKGLPEEVLVVYDELALPFGTVRVRYGGESAGHNGIKSVTAGISSDFWRLRIGIANEHTNQNETTDFVLSNFSKDEQQQLPGVFERTSEVIEKFTAGEALQPNTQRIS